MSSLLSVSKAVAGLSASRRPAREDELQEDNDALVQEALAAVRLQGAAEEALRRQTQALALASHELRNPLMPIRTVAALLSEATSLDQLPRLTAVLERQVVHMTRMIDDLLDAARVTTGKLHLDRARCSTTSSTSPSPRWTRGGRRSRCGSPTVRSCSKATCCG